MLEVGETAAVGQHFDMFLLSAYKHGHRRCHSLTQSLGVFRHSRKLSDLTSHTLQEQAQKLREQLFHRCSRVSTRLLRAHSTFLVDS